MPPACTRPRTVRSRAAALLVALVTFSVVTPVTAQTDEIEDAKAQREAARAEAADRAGELDPLLAQDDELEAAVAALELHVSTKQAKLEATQQSLASARDDAATAGDRVIAMQDTITELRGRLGDRAVAAYVSPNDQDFDDFFTSDDLTTAAHKRALIDTVSGNDVDLLDQLRAAQDTLVDLEETAAAALVVVEEQEALEADQLAEVEDALVEQERVKAALEDRIAEVTNEIAALEAEEEALSQLILDLIAEEEARKRAEEEARRRAAEQARIAAEQERLAAEREASGRPGDDVALPTPEPLPAPSTASGLAWPASGVLSSPFGPRWGRQHQGIDIAAPTGTPIWAAQSGTVISAGVLGGYGNMVLIDHGNGFTTIYGHMSEIYVSAGQGVGRGETIGTMGCTGSCTGPHVHFETRVSGVPQDPMLYLS